MYSSTLPQIFWKVLESYLWRSEFKIKWFFVEVIFHDSTNCEFDEVISILLNIKEIMTIWAQKWPWHNIFARIPMKGDSILTFSLSSWDPWIAVVSFQMGHSYFNIWYGFLAAKCLSNLYIKPFQYYCYATSIIFLKRNVE